MPNEICTQHWSVLGTFDTEIEAEYFITYVHSSLFKFIIWMNCSEGVTGLSKVILSHVPLLSLTKHYTDQELYKMFKLTQEEINYIESTIKPMQ